MSMGVLFLGQAVNLQAIILGRVRGKMAVFSHVKENRTIAWCRNHKKNKRVLMSKSTTVLTNLDQCFQIKSLAIIHT